MGYGKEDESEEKVYQEYGVANSNDTIKNQYSEDVHHVRLGINKRVDSYTTYTLIDYMLQIKLYYGEDYGYEDDYNTPGLGLVNIIINNSTGTILSESESASVSGNFSIRYATASSEKTYFFDEFEELFDSDIEDFGDQLKTEFNNAINSFEKDWVNNIKSDKDFKIELEKLFDFNKILTRLKEYQVKIIEKNIVVDSKKNQHGTGPSKIEDLKFTPQLHGGIGAKLKTKGRVSISIQAGKDIYSTPSEDGLEPKNYSHFEVAVFDTHGEFITEKYLNCKGDSVAGYVTRDEINNLLTLLSSKIK